MTVAHVITVPYYVPNVGIPSSNDEQRHFAHPDLLNRIYLAFAPAPQRYSLSKTQKRGPVYKGDGYENARNFLVAYCGLDVGLISIWKTSNIGCVSQPQMVMRITRHTAWIYSQLG